MSKDIIERRRSELEDVLDVRLKSPGVWRLAAWIGSHETKTISTHHSKEAAEAAKQEYIKCDLSELEGLLSSAIPGCHGND